MKVDVDRMNFNESECMYVREGEKERKKWLDTVHKEFNSGLREDEFPFFRIIIPSSLCLEFVV